MIAAQTGAKKRQSMREKKAIFWFNVECRGLSGFELEGIK